jgi:hypothetical protein
VTAGQHQPAPPKETSPDVSIHVTTPACLLSVIPHLLGFQPVNSLIIIGTEPSSHKAKVTLRYELPDPPDPRAAARSSGTRQVSSPPSTAPGQSSSATAPATWSPPSSMSCRTSARLWD